MILGANVDMLPNFDLTSGRPSLPSVVLPKSEVQSTRQSSRRPPARSNVRAKSELDDKANVQAPDSNGRSGAARPSVSPQEARDVGGIAVIVLRLDAHIYIWDD